MKLSVTPAWTPADVFDLLGVIAFEEDLSTTVGMPAAALPVSSLLQSAIGAQRFKGKVGQTLVVDTQGQSGARRIALVGAGPRSAFRQADYRHAAAVITRIATSGGARSVIVLDDANPAPAGTPSRPESHGQDTNKDALTRLEALSQGALLGAYRFEKYLGIEKRAPMAVETVSFQIGPALADVAAAAAVARGERTAGAVCYARDLINEPAGSLTPTALADDVAARAGKLGLGVTVLGRDQCQARGMGMFLAVAQGSVQEPKFIHLKWCPPGGADRRIVLVGKGVTFDSGGLSLKTNEGMQDMKSDMAGAAAVLSAILVAAEEKLPIEVHALAACTENMPSGTAYKLGDVLRSMSGKTVEINNTDAEGRLTLADALTYGLELKPHVVIDFATLTGACMVALGPHTAGVMTNDEAAAAGWMTSAGDAGEDMWRLPLPPRLLEQLKSEIADLRNTGERWGGALTAGLFLKEFVGTTPWIHVDLAGPATATKEWGCYGKGGTGFAVATILQYLRSAATSAAVSPRR
jgi:leucyl aminopeptidase